MDINQFERLIDKLRELSSMEDIASVINIDLHGFSDKYHAVIMELLEALYGEAGADWIVWYCYENDFGRGDLKAYDKDNKEICNTIESLYKTVRNEN